jgi:hypothetical protein
MEPRTVERLEDVRKALLALTDDQLVILLESWINGRVDMAGELGFEDDGAWLDEMCTSLGYRVCRNLDGVLYETLAAFEKATGLDQEDNDEANDFKYEWEIISPSPEQLRERIASLPTKQFDNIVGETAFQALHESHKNWGYGQEFLTALADTIRAYSRFDDIE